MKTVDDNKNNLTYFVRVDWHLPERELTKTSEANLCFEHLKTCLVLWRGVGTVAEKVLQYAALGGGYHLCFFPKLQEVFDVDATFSCCCTPLGHWGYHSSQAIFTPGRSRRSH